MQPTQTSQPQATSQTPSELFNNTFGHAPQYLVTSPGRVNLIGEHTDYNLLPVLPMPIDRAIRIAVSPRTDAIVRFVNANDRFAPFEISLFEPIQPLPGHWGNYCRAAIRAVVTELQATGASPRGFNALVQSDLPPASGLSSSSALVIGTCLAMLQVNNVEWSANEIAERMRLAEQFVGTAGGGMDQAVIALGQPDSALVIEFDPLNAQPIRIPDNIAIFVINSGQKAEKTGAARYNYNRRALECAIAVELLKRTMSNHQTPAAGGTAEFIPYGPAQRSQTPKLAQRPTGSAGIPAGQNASLKHERPSLAQRPNGSAGGPPASNILHPDSPTQWSSLRDIYHSLPTSPLSTETSPTPNSQLSTLNSTSPGSAPLSTVHYQLSTQPSPSPTLNSPWPPLLLHHLRPDPLTIPQLETLIPRETLAQLCASKKLDLDSAQEWLPDGLLQIFPRVAHVFSEADRVYALRDAFARNDREAAFHISRAGHASCRDLYHISTPEIENLIHVAYQAGAGSARITGAGFGGCIVALVPSENAEEFPQKLQQQGVPAQNIIKAKSQGGARVTP